jgi:uncharacterized heparinase superfamily protein
MAEPKPKPLLGPTPIRLPRSPWVEAAVRLLARQAAIESFGAPGYGLTLAGPRADGLAAAPRDLRPVDLNLGRAVLNGRFAFAGETLEAPRPGDPWNRPSPSRACAVELHRFSWLPHLLAVGDAGAREALRLTFRWRDTFGTWSPFAWSREVLPWRVFYLACAARRLAAVSGAGDARAIAELLGRQARHLLRLPDDPAWAAEHTTAAAVAGAALTGEAGEKLLDRALPRLKRALSRTVLSDGCHASRSPEAGLELLLNLLALDDGLIQRGVETPAEVVRAIDRLTQALRVLTLADGRLACFHGGESSSAERVAIARAHDDADGTVPAYLPRGRFHRLQGRLLQVLIDAGAPAAGAWAQTACAQPLAIEIVCGRDRLITNSGWSPRQAERQGFRLTGAGSTVTLGETSVLEPLQGRVAGVLGPRLEGPQIRVEARRHEAERAVWVDLAHDGWVPRFGLVHERRLYLDTTADELRGEDRMTPQPGIRVRPLAAPYAVRFHLYPGLQVSLARDRRSVLLRGPSGRGWWLRNDAAEVSIEPSIHFEAGAPRKAAQVVLRGVARTDGLTRVRWKIAPAGGPDEAMTTPVGPQQPDSDFPGEAGR